MNQQREHLARRKIDIVIVVSGKLLRCESRGLYDRAQSARMAEKVEKLTTGESLTIDQLLEYLPALKEIPGAQLENWGEDAAVQHRFRKGEIVCREGEFGSTAYYIVSGTVDIFIDNPLAHLRNRPATGVFGRSFARMKSFLTSDAEDRRAEAHQRQFIGIDADVDLPVHRPLAQLGPGDLFGEVTCRTIQPRSATVQTREPCIMVEMLRVILDMLVGNRQPSKRHEGNDQSEDAHIQRHLI